ncbi:hypothetical protein ILUMI_20342, partial [Ignelater luminosus]
MTIPFEPDQYISSEYLPLYTEILPYCRSTLHLNAEQQIDSTTYLNMIKHVLAYSSRFVFSIIGRP